MDTVAGLLNQSLDPRQARAAEQELRKYDKQQGFTLTLLQIVNSNQLPMGTRLAGALFFKNLIRRLWTDEDGNYLLPETDVVAVKNEIIPLMISLPSALQAQIGEAVSGIADSDFPDRWVDLIPDLVARLGTDAKVNNGVLKVAHSIFKRWRPLFSSDDLLREIKLVLEQFVQPYYALMLETHKRIEQTSGNKDVLLELLKTMGLLVKLFYDLNCQDIPEFFEDHIKQFMDILHNYLIYSNPLVETTEDSESGILEVIKTDICEILQLYTQRYEEEFRKALPTFVGATWTLLTTIGLQSKYDLLVNRALAFLTSVAKIERHIHMFEATEVLTLLIEKIVIPNMTMRESDEEMFEDDPIEFIRRDLEGSDSDTRRRAATDFLRELVTKMDSRVTEAVMRYVNGFLEQYAANPAQNWKAKNTASYLFSSVAAKGNVTAAGVSTTNLAIDVVGFFTSSIAPDLVSTTVNPILQVDAIRFIHNFRNQLTKEQLSQALPLLVQLLNSRNYVVYTYAAITIERILSVRQNNVSVFKAEDIQSEAAQLISALMQLILRSASTSEKLSENEFLMKCIMRVLLTVQGAMQPFAAPLLPQLVQIMTAVSVNPSNPRFNHFLFESIGAVVRYAGAQIGISGLEEHVVQPMLQILGQDITEFIPYVLQILTEVLSLQPAQSGLPESFRQLIRPLMAPVLWEPKGNVPALVGLLEVILSRGASVVVSDGLLTPLLGVFQNLVASRSNDQYGLELLEYIFYYVGHEHLKELSKQVAQLLLMRLQQSNTDKFCSRFSLFMYFLASTEANNLGPAYAIFFLDQVQQGVFGQVMTSFMLPSTLKIGGTFNRRIAAVGLTKLLCRTTEYTTGEYSSQWAHALDILVRLMKYNMAEEHTSVPIGLDLEELSFGSSFSKLATTAAKPLDPVPDVKHPVQFFNDELKQLAEKFGPAVQQLLQNLDAESREYLRQQGV